MKAFMRVLAVLLLFGSIAALPRTAFAGNASVCDEPATAEGVDRVRIDLATGSSSGKLEHRTGKQVAIFFVNANPFAFDYQVDQDLKVLEEPDLAKFQKSWIPAAASSETPKKPEPEKAAQPDEAAKLVDALEEATSSKLMAKIETLRPAKRCSADDIRMAWKNAGVKSGFANLEKAQGDAKKLTQSASKTLSTAGTSWFSALEIVKARTQCSQIVDAASLMRDAAVIALATADGSIRGMEAASTSLASEIGRQRKRRDRLEDLLWEASCDGKAVRREVEKIDDNLDEYRAYDELLTTDLAEAKAQRKALQEKVEAVSQVLSSPSRFQWTRSVHGPHEPAEITIKISRRELGAKAYPAKPWTELTLHFGGRRRFQLAVGLAYSDLAPQSYKPVQAFEVDEAGELVRGTEGDPKLGTVVGREEASDHRLGAAVFLHARLTDGLRIKGPLTGLHLTVGVDEKLLGFDSDAQVLAGLSLSFAEERLFLTVGALNGRVEHLRQGWHEGRPLGELAEVPVTNDREWAPAFGISWHLSQ